MGQEVPVMGNIALNHQHNETSFLMSSLSACVSLGFLSIYLNHTDSLK